MEPYSPFKGYPVKQFWERNRIVQLLDIISGKTILGTKPYSPFTGYPGKTILGTKPNIPFTGSGKTILGTKPYIPFTGSGKTILGTEPDSPFTGYPVKKFWERNRIVRLLDIW